MSLITTVFQPTLTDAWLSGFTDAEGTFTINITKRDNTKTGYRVQLRYLLDQKYAVQGRHVSILLLYISFIGLAPIISYFDTRQSENKKSSNTK